MSWKCKECGAAVRTFDILCSSCNAKNSTDLDNAARIRVHAPELLACSEALVAALDASPDIGACDFGKQRAALEEVITKMRGAT